MVHGKRVFPCPLQLMGSREGAEMRSRASAGRSSNAQEASMNAVLRRLSSEEEGQDIAEYAVMLAVILVIVVGTIRLIGTSANNVFSSVASSIQ
jgi:Flp pilus assembly pilin Flp